MSSHPAPVPSERAQPPKRITIPSLRELKREGRKFAMVTAYDYPQARTVDEAGIEVILVGDSAANVIHGHESTLPITMDLMLAHTRAVVRGRKRALVVGDMPFLSYQVSPQQAIENAGRFLKEAGADCVKLEGGEDVRDIAYAVVKAGIPVMGHIGLTPQTVSKLGGYKVQGRDVLSARALVDAAIALEDAGVFSIVLECVPSEVAKEVTERLEIPTIGIGAGAWCDAQVLVYHDLLGLSLEGFRPRFVKRYANLAQEAVAALRRFAEEVRSGAFPDDEHGFAMHEGEGEKLPFALSGPFHKSVGDGLVSPPVPTPKPQGDGLIAPAPKDAREGPAAAAGVGGAR